MLDTRVPVSAGRASPGVCKRQAGGRRRLPRIFNLPVNLTVTAAIFTTAAGSSAC